MRRFWIEFPVDDSTPLALVRGVGVTAENEDEALALVRRDVLRGEPLPLPSRIVPDVDVSTLDEHHVLPNVGVVIWRGIWFPSGFERWKDD